MDISMDSIKRSLWHKVTSYFLTAFMIMQVTLPSVALAVTSATNDQLEEELTTEQLFIRSLLTSRLFERSQYIDEQPLGLTNQTITQFHSELKETLPHRLISEITSGWVPIAENITILIPSERTIYPLGKVVGDAFVQRKLINNQIKRLIGRAYYQQGFNSEHAQIQQLYANALVVAARSSFEYQMGNILPEGIADTLETDFIWPENRLIGGEVVLVPVVHLQTNTVTSKGIDGSHTVEFSASNATFKSVTITNADIALNSDTVFKTINDLVIGTKSSISIDTDARIYAGVSFIENDNGNIEGVATGTLYNYGQINSTRNVDIVAGNYLQKTFVHRFNTPYGYEDKLGTIAAINAGGGISIRAYGEIALEAATLGANGGSINLYSEQGNIYLGAQKLSSSSSFKVKGGTQTEQGVNYVQSILSAQDNISLYAAGIIEINAAELYAEEGAISILAANGIYILNELGESSSNMDRKWRNTTETEHMFETTAIRSVLEAGKGVIIASDFGDITLKATKITSTDGSEISAHNGRVNFLLAEEQNHYYYNNVKETFFKIKTETQQDRTGTGVYNEIIGGVKVHATHGLTLELGKYDGESLTEVITQFSDTDTLSWMADIYNNPEYNYDCPPLDLPQAPDGYSEYAYKAIQAGADFRDPEYPQCQSLLEVVTRKLENIHEYDKTSQLSPAAMAIIAIAVSVALGPGAGIIGNQGVIVSAYPGALGSAMSAGVVTLSTSVATSLANGEGIDGAIENITSSDGLRSLAISMATAGVLNSEAFNSLDLISNNDFASSFFTNEVAIDIATQATEAVVRSTVTAGIATVINGGDLGDFEDTFKASLIDSGIDALGEVMTDKINDAFSLGDNNFDTAMTYISHAAAGCIIGATTFATTDSEQQESNDSAANSCAAASAGAVVGTAIGHATISADAYKDEIEALTTKIYASDFDENKHGKILDFVKTQEFQNFALGSLHNLRDQGADISKLFSALAVFAAGGSAQQVNLSADMSEQAARTQVQTAIQLQVSLAAANFMMSNQQPDDYFVNLADNERYEEFVEYYNAKKNNSSLAEGARTLEDAKSVATQFLKLNTNATDQQISDIVDSPDFEKTFYDAEAAMENLRGYIGNFAQVGENQYQKSKFTNSDEELANLERKMIATPELVPLLLQEAQPVLQPIGQVSRELVEQIDNNPVAKWTLLALEFAAGPVGVIAGKAIEHSFVGDYIAENAQKAHTDLTKYVDANSDLNEADAADVIAGAGIIFVVVTLPRQVRDLTDNISISQEILRTNRIADFGNILDGANLSAAQRASLESELSKNSDLAKAIADNPDLVDSWKALDNAGVDAVVRSDPKWLDRVSGWTDDGLEVATEGKILKEGNEVGRIVGNNLEVKYTGHGGDIVCAPDKTTTLVGKWDDPAGGGTKDIKDSKLSKSGENAGSTNVLSEDIPDGWTEDQTWDNVNEPWLKDAADRGDVIRVVSDPMDPANIYKPDLTTLSFFGREHELLTKPVSQGGLGYTYNPSTFSYTK